MDGFASQMEETIILPGRASAIIYYGVVHQLHSLFPGIGQCFKKLQRAFHHSDLEALDSTYGFY